MLLGNNKSVVVNTTQPSSMLKKKHQACNYHQVREAIAAGFIQFGFIVKVKAAPDRNNQQQGDEPDRVIGEC